MTSTELAQYRLFDYERELASRELSALTRLVGRKSPRLTEVVRDRSTYFRSVEGVSTVQADTEKRHHSERGSSSSRQATRYLVHGLHEYKGKFNPQTARALINAIDPDATAVIDPYCGSGTTLIEGMRLGLTAVGIDQNPLAVWMSQIKVETVELAGTINLSERFDAVASRVLLAAREGQRVGHATAPPLTGSDDEAYLRHWFPEPVLAALWEGLRACQGESDPIASVAQLCISSVVRQVSWQLPEDLRVRRRASSWTPPSVGDLLSTALGKARMAVAEVARAPRMSDSVSGTVHLGSSRDSRLLRHLWPSGRCVVVTSPPYATALPYIDTDRLSIVLLGLGSANQLSSLEQQLTGSREWRSSDANSWSSGRAKNVAGLPSTITGLLDRIEDVNRVSGAGFRRRAVPTLLYRYFTQMGETLSALSSSMSPGEHVVMVVGRNRTGDGQHRIEIPTPELLGALATTRGFHYTERIPFETWARYSMHSRNAVNAEDAVVMTVL